LRQLLEISQPILYHWRFRIQGLPVFFFGWQPQGQASRKLGLAISLTFALLVPGVAFAKGPAPGSDTVSLSQLPPQAQETERLIRSGGPFPFPRKDGVVFGNRERILDAKPRGYYREYTVKTPGSRNRGARRIVCGGRQPTQPDACFYSDDHYASFRRIVQ
jgi:ribonuclease T1